MRSVVCRRDYVLEKRSKALASSSLQQDDAARDFAEGLLLGCFESVRNENMWQNPTTHQPSTQSRIVRLGTVWSINYAKQLPLGRASYPFTAGEP